MRGVSGAVGSIQVRPGDGSDTVKACALTPQKDVWAFDLNPSIYTTDTSHPILFEIPAMSESV
jgi:hypothetical protein